MSTYCSDPEIDERLSDVHGFVDVAGCCVGSNVRLIVTDGCLRLEPAEARVIAEALNRAATFTEAPR